MKVSQEEKRRIIDLHFNQGKTIREVCKIMGKSSHDITPVTKEYRIQLAQNYALAIGEQSDLVQLVQDRVIPNVKAYKLFDEGKSPLEVAAELNLPGQQAQQYYFEYWNLRKMHELVTIYRETQNNIGYFLKLFRLGKQEGLTPEQVMKFIQMADSIYKLQEKLRQLQSELLDISKKKSADKDQLKDLYDKIESAQEKLNSVNKTFEVKYEGLREACSQAQKLQHYVEEFKEDQGYQELESKIRIEVGKFVSDHKKLLQNALFSVMLALRNDPDRYLIIDKMELTPFTTTILNYNSFLGSRRTPGNEQFGERILEVAEKIFCNLQNVIVDNTISTAAELEKGSSYPETFQALPYYNSPPHLPGQRELK